MRRLEPERRPARGGARGRQSQGAARATKSCSRNTISPTARSSKSGLAELCAREEIGVITYFSLAKGFLSGKYRSEADLAKSPRGGGVKAYLNPRGFRILDALEKVAASHKAKPAEVALAWIMARPGVTAPIASATSVEQVDSLVRATELKLTAADMDGARHGERALRRATSPASRGAGAHSLAGFVVAQFAAQDLADVGLRQRVAELDMARDLVAGQILPGSRR